MHIPDGFLDLPVCVATYGASIAFLALALRGMNRRLEERQVPLMATLTAMFFATQMVNYPIIGGTTAHLLGGPALALTLGPYAGLVSMTIILLIQALFFGDGGLTTLGANILNMGVIGVFVPYLVCLASTRVAKGMRGLLAGAFLGGLLGDLLAAVSAGLELGLSSAIFPYSATVAVAAMGTHHFIIGLLEGFATASLISLIHRARPDLLELPKVAPKWLSQPAPPRRAHGGL